MKTRFIIVFLLLISAMNVKATEMLDIPILWDLGDDIIHVMDLPDTEEYSYTDDDGEKHYVDLGIKHGQFSLFLLPLINYGDKEYVFYSDNGFFSSDTYISMPSEALSSLKQTYNLSDEPELPFWDAWGGKIVMILIILVFVYGVKLSD